MNIALIIFILKTGLVTLLLVGGIYTLVLSRQKFTSILGNLFGTNDLEVTTGNVVFLKAVGALVTLFGAYLIWHFFLYTPGASS